VAGAIGRYRLDLAGQPGTHLLPFGTESGLAMEQDEVMRLHPPRL